MRCANAVTRHGAAQYAQPRKIKMNNGTLEEAALTSHTRSTEAHQSATDELSRAKRELLQAEVRLAKARANAAAAEVDIKVFGARLKSLVK